MVQIALPCCIRFNNDYCSDVHKGGTRILPHASCFLGDNSWGTEERYIKATRHANRILISVAGMHIVEEMRLVAT